MFQEDIVVNCWQLNIELHVHVTRTASLANRLDKIDLPSDARCRPITQNQCATWENTFVAFICGFLNLCSRRNLNQKINYRRTAQFCMFLCMRSCDILETPANVRNIVNMNSCLSNYLDLRWSLCSFRPLLFKRLKKFKHLSSEVNLNVA